jgi:nitroimidazol reductase NimA-like FMN-containing flavoprotein (pyridoxamine 5'-phosphate oxidase superfamily)
MNDDPRLLTDANIWLATTRPNGKPHLIPIWFVWVDGRFYICTPEDSVKARNLRANPRASVSLEDGSKPVIAECTAEFLQKPYPAAVVEGFVRKYDWEISNDTAYQALIALTPQKWLHWQPG